MQNAVDSAMVSRGGEEMSYDPKQVQHFEVTDTGSVFAVMPTGEPLWWFGELSTQAFGCFVKPAKKRKNGRGKKGC